MTANEISSDLTTNKNPSIPLSRSGEHSPDVADAETFFKMEKMRLCA